MKLEKDIKILRENFIQKFCKQKGWNPNELTTNQMLVITQQDRYKNPF
jgi:DNA-binding NtrC family response regulator